MRPGTVATTFPGGGVRDQQVQGQVLTGELGSGLRPAHVQRALVTQPTEHLGPAADGLVEVVAVGGIHQPVEVHEPVLVDVIDVEVAVVGGLLAVGLGAFGVVAEHGFGDEALELGPPDAGGVPQLPVHEPRGLSRQAAGEVRDPLSTPRRQPPRHHGLVDVGQPPGALDDPSDIGLATVGGAAEDRDELHQRELADQRGAGSGDGDAGVEVALGDRRRTLGSGDDVVARPGRDVLPLLDDEGVAGADPVAHPRQQSCCRTGPGSEIHD
ncbi:hypothetical protein GCM10023066_04610 [Nocardioides kongjuensis]